MPTAEYCLYPPQISDSVEVSEQRDRERCNYIIGLPQLGRYILLRPLEYDVVGLIDGKSGLVSICEKFHARYGKRLTPATLSKFLVKLDEVGILAGERQVGANSSQAGMEYFLRFKLFNPERLFTAMLKWLGWIWTPGFVVVSLLIMVFVLFLTLANWAEVSRYSDLMLRYHWWAIFIAGWFIIMSHEFAHGMTCKAFGGRTPEVGLLMVYYFLPALYCNVSGIHLIPKRSQRMWVILAGVYWQLLVGTLFLLGWFLFAPHTLISKLCFIFFLGSVVNIVFNGNPLIKLDGYYFLSQALQIPNLMERSRAYWFGWWRRVVYGEVCQLRNSATVREQAIYAVFGALSTIYGVVLVLIIVNFLNQYLIDKFYLLGLLLSGGVVILFIRRPIMSMVSVIGARLAGLFTWKSVAEGVTNNEKDKNETGQPAKLRRRLVLLALAAVAISILLFPWQASVGSYGILAAMPEREIIIRASDNATLIELQTQPGELITSGKVIGRLGNLELDEEIVQARTELARAQAEYNRQLIEVRAHQQIARRSQLQLAQRHHDYNEIQAEQRQIEEHLAANANQANASYDRTVKILRTSILPDQTTAFNNTVRKDVTSYPAAIAVLEDEIAVLLTRLEKANRQLERTRNLFREGIIAQTELDSAQTQSATLTIELSAARKRLESSLIDHSRKYTNTTTEMKLARADASGEYLQIEKAETELHSLINLMAALSERLKVLEKKQAQFELISPRNGIVFGAELPRMIGQYFKKGAEICRIADTRQLLVRIQVPEREIGDVREGDSVRLKALSYPDRIFAGRVSKIGSESEIDQYNQSVYRVELTIENSDGQLRPGMSAFARIDFARHPIGWIILHKIKQALRPELWML